MSKDNFTAYTSKEMRIFQTFVDSNPWLKNELKEFYLDNTSFHDLKCEMNNGYSFTVEVKEEERYWFDKTGNLGLDYISAFIFKRNKYLWTRKHKYWVDIEKLKSFMEDINILKWGKLVTCDADVQLFYVKDKLCRVYDNSKLKSPKFVKYLNSNYKLRINNKHAYNISENWESAAYFVGNQNSNLNECLVDNMKNLNNAIRSNE